MNQKDAEQIYINQVKRSEELINDMGDNPQAKNAFITNTYATLFQKEPAFLWFSLGTIVSCSVGKNLLAASQALIHSAGKVESAKVILDEFSKGNQAIFKDITPLFLTYESIGLEGIKLLVNSDVENPFKNTSVLEAMENYSLLQAKQYEIAQSLNLPLTDEKVVFKLLANKENMKIAHSVAIAIAYEEQNIVQKMYEGELTDIFINPSLNWAGQQLKLDEIKILDKPYPFFDYVDNPVDFNQRMEFASILLEAIEKRIFDGEFLEYQFDVFKYADFTLWMANPNTHPQAIGEINGVYWGSKADEHDQKIKDSVLAFLNPAPAKALVLAYLNPEQSTKDVTISNPIENNEKNDIATIFNGEHEIVKINMDPLSLFLATNPNYEVIAHDFAELWASTNYFRTPIWGGTALWNPDLSYLKNSTYLAIYDFGEYRYYQPYGEVRGITFPFIYDKTTGTPLTMPIKDAAGHYDHVSTIDMIYNNPEVFNQPSHINWYNPYWNSLVQQAQQTAINHYFKSITVESFMNNILAPTSSISFYNSNLQIELKGSDILHNEFDNIDFSSLKGLGQGNGSAIVSMVLANGTTFEVDKSGNFVCINCSSGDSVILEQAANAFLHQII